MRAPLRSTAIVAATAMLSGLLGTQLLAPAQAVGGTVKTTYAPPVDCRQTAPVDPSTPPATPETPPASEAPVGAPAPPDSYSPRNGTLTYNNPLGSTAARRANLTVILRSINSSPTCSKIQIATWNLRSAEATAALKAAVRRGVTVQLIMSAGNNGPTGTDTYNPVFLDLRDWLKASNVDPTTPAHMRNWAAECFRSCRYAGGAAHSKYYMFSRAGSAAKVVHYGSYNLTDAASWHQWNDLYTVVNPEFYSYLTQIFAESKPERNLADAFRRESFGNLTMDVYSYRGAGRTGDPIMSVLNQVKCTSAGTVGANGRTALRINVAAILGDRGLALANKLVRLRRAGCNIKLLATNLGYHIIKALQAGGVPTRQLVSYDDRTRLYTKYTHTKVLAISGNWGGRSNQQISWNGTANWTAATLESDELVGKVTSAAVTNKYNYFVNYWFSRTPNGRRLVPTTNNPDGRQSDPWSLVERDY